jgi:hypothetical protein
MYHERHEADQVQDPDAGSEGVLARSQKVPQAPRWKGKAEGREAAEEARKAARTTDLVAGAAGSRRDAGFCWRVCRSDEADAVKPHTHLNFFSLKQFMPEDLP